MTNNSISNAAFDSSQNWKINSINMLKERVKWELSAQSPQNEATDLLKKKEEENLKLKLTENKIMELETQLDKLNSDSAQIKSSVLKLFQHCTHLVFDFKSSPTKISGYVIEKSSHKFEFDPSRHSQHDIINRLWKLIDQYSN